MKNQNSTLRKETDLSDTDTQRQQIAQRAYELYEARRCFDGFDLQDWLQAESEILSEVAESEEGPLDLDSLSTEAEVESDSRGMECFNSIEL